MQKIISQYMYGQPDYLVMALVALLVCLGLWLTYQALLGFAGCSSGQDEYLDEYDYRGPLTLRSRVDSEVTLVKAPSPEDLAK